MSRGYTKRRKELVQVINTLPGFELLEIERSKNDHYCCLIRDDAGNEFKAFTGQTCSGDDRKARLNFKQDIRKMSNRIKGLIE